MIFSSMQEYDMTSNQGHNDSMVEVAMQIWLTLIMARQSHKK